ncbi:hypothetical protein [Gracilibacillus lacisalsi]|uniref:hypothetical protein n=1 Tax=Gracilibacillus lacisalsi TaxID=393087 RepID=UPI000372908A|nr:hypothetical protein [Gracilibacillus lacisalsi]
MKHLQELKNIKDRYRNVISHGGFEKNGESANIQLEGVGAVPVLLSKYNKSVHYSFVPIEKQSFEDICKIIDDFKQDIDKDVHLKRCIMIVDAGIDVYYDDSSVHVYNEILQSNKTVEKYIEDESAIFERNANMDW